MHQPPRNMDPLRVLPPPDNRRDLSELHLNCFKAKRNEDRRREGTTGAGATGEFCWAVSPAGPFKCLNLLGSPSVFLRARCRSTRAPSSRALCNVTNVYHMLFVLSASPGGRRACGGVSPCQGVGAFSDTRIALRSAKKCPSKGREGGEACDRQLLGNVTLQPQTSSTEHCALGRAPSGGGQQRTPAKLAPSPAPRGPQAGGWQAPAARSLLTQCVVYSCTAESIVQPHP